MLSIAIISFALDNSPSEVYATSTSGTHTQTNRVPLDLICTESEANRLSTASGGTIFPYEQDGIVFDSSKDPNKRAPLMIRFADGSESQVKPILNLMAISPVGTKGVLVGSGNSWKWEPAPIVKAEVPGQLNVDFAVEFRKLQTKNPNRPWDGSDRELLIAIAKRVGVLS